ncbi:MAG: hypothetical protein A3F80_08155 [Candidatus Melainabacteria bacterium RIFCSPLOWO2_12_FULL_35_11]|nr:MAG: hypothetical protein A3F80_08155 [Candidatus Melainabacteria bacterium RIFCSPLOWO2_12_FULL_35_11]
MNHKKGSSLPTILVGFYSNPEHVSPLIDSIEILAKDFKVLVVARNIGTFSYKYPKNVSLYVVGPRCEIIEQFSFPIYKKICGYFLFILKLFNLLRRECISILFLYDLHAFLAGYIANKISRNVPIFYHQSVTSLSKELLKSRCIYWMKYLEFFFCRSVSVLSFPDPYIAKLFLEDAALNKNNRKVIIVENCPKRIEQLPKPAFQMQRLKDRGNRIVLHRGPLKGTNITEVIRSIKYWPQNVILVLVGFYPTDPVDMYKNIANEENAYNKIIFVPYLPSREELLEFMVIADLGLVIYKIVDLNHKYMGPTKLYDYLALGIPVLAPKEMSFISGLVRELGVGLIYDRPTPEIIGKIIFELLEHPDRHKTSQKARQIHLSRLNYETQFQPVMDEIRTLLIKK